MFKRSFNLNQSIVMSIQVYITAIAARTCRGLPFFLLLHIYRIEAFALVQITRRYHVANYAFLKGANTSLALV